MNTTSATSPASEDFSPQKGDKKYQAAAYELYALTSLIAGDLRDRAKSRINDSTTSLEDPKLFDTCVDDVYQHFGVDANEVPSKNKIDRARRVADGFYAKRRTP